jgi:hypothetical protein
LSLHLFSVANLEDEWPVIARLLPRGWQQAARDTGAFSRARGLAGPGPLLRALLFHAVSNGTLRSSVAQLRKAKIVALTDEAFRQRLRASADWLAWVAQRLARRHQRRTPDLRGLRPRAIDSTTIQNPSSQGTQWRLHYTLDLLTLDCDWHQLTDAHGSELLERAKVRPGDVLLADRNFLRPAGVRAVRDAQAHVLVRLRWTHPALLDERRRPLRALSRARTLRVGEAGDWPATLVEPDGPGLVGRVVIVKLPLPLARRAQRKAEKQARKKGKRVDPRSLEAARYVMLFTTLPSEVIDCEGVLEWYRFRWQIELGFKRLKQLLKLGKLPHSDPGLARAWILAKVVVALLLETLYRQAETLSPWGYDRQEAEPVALGRSDAAQPGTGAVSGPKRGRLGSRTRRGGGAKAAAASPARGGGQIPRAMAS